MRPEAGLYSDVLRSCEQSGLRYVVIGGMALALHGSPRPTADLDIAVDPAPEEADRAMRLLLHLRFHPTIPLPLSLAVVLTWLDGGGRRIDVLTRTLVPFSTLWETSELVRSDVALVRTASLPQLYSLQRARKTPVGFREAEGIARFVAARAELERLGNQSGAGP